MFVIVGFGYVGSALHATANAVLPHLIIDVKFPNLSSWNEVSQRKDIEGIIVCVSTPEGPGGQCNIGSVQAVLNLIKRFLPTVPILIKSTVSLDGWDSLKRQYSDLRISYSPEFLKAETAVEDFKNQQFVIISRDNQSDYAVWQNYFLQILPNARLYSCSAKEAIMIKYASNSFLSVKVSFFNHIYDICQLQNLNFDTVRALLAMRNDIGVNHTKITEERGWGGHCFPKDTAALLYTCKLLGYDFSTLQAAVNYNLSIRSKEKDKQ